MSGDSIVAHASMAGLHIKLLTKSIVLNFATCPDTLCIAVKAGSYIEAVHVYVSYIPAAVIRRVRQNIKHLDCLKR